MTIQERTNTIITHLNKMIIRIDLGFSVIERSGAGGYYGYHILLKNNRYYWYKDYITDRFGFNYNIHAIENYMDNKYANQ